MGYLTTIVLHNDAMGEFERDPKAFGEAILKAIALANQTRLPADVPIGSYANYISSFPSRHADDHTVYVHRGNTVAELNAYSSEFENAVKNNVEWAKEIVKTADGIVKDAKKLLAKK